MVPENTFNFAFDKNKRPAQGGLTEPKSHTSKNCFIDSVSLGLAARSAGPVENTWELWCLWLDSHRHSRRAQETLHGRSLGCADMCRPILTEPPEHFWQIQILALAEVCWQPVSDVRAGPGAVTPVSLQPLPW